MRVRRDFPRAKERRPRINKRRGANVGGVAGDGKAPPGTKIHNTRGLLRIPSRCEGRGKCWWPLVCTCLARSHTVKCLVFETEHRRPPGGSRFGSLVRGGSTDVIYSFTALTLRTDAFFPFEVVEPTPDSAS